MSSQKYVAMEDEEGVWEDDGRGTKQGGKVDETATLSESNIIKNDPPRDTRVRHVKQSSSSIPIIRRRNNILARNLSLVEIFGGIMLLVMFATRWTLLRDSYLCTWYTGLWGGLFLVFTGVVGCITNYILRRGYFIAWMILSLILALQCATIFTLHTFEIFLELNRNTDMGDAGLKATSKVIWNCVMVVLSFLLMIVSIITTGLSMKVVFGCESQQNRRHEEEPTVEDGDIQLMSQHQGS
ncbi:unnamed protein product [Owenia fusiformis]|uniref:Uncharacterized protein n=1 Tax=Owenia fusiformis TaxID=6347 RepID=A0A8J1TTQ6_OWEFU|nr:unnamed protein product [Owenia fusiformis]